MARLPTPGGDDGTWGAVLNDYLSQVHAADGTLKTGVVSTSQINAINGPTAGYNLTYGASGFQWIAPAAHSHDGSAINAGTVGVAYLPVAASGTVSSTQVVRADDTRLLANVTRVLHNGTDYPARPVGATYVEWVGPTQPAAAVNGDTWVSTA
jgi:hypothetical protein